MSVHESSDAPREDVAQFTRWPGIMSLALGVLLAPTAALANQQLIYAADTYACGRNLRATLHVVPALALIVAIGACIAAYINWRAVGKGLEEEHGGIAARTRFLALLGIAVSAFSALVIAGQWLSIFMFSACARA
jgi:uncharacterized membrane protein